MRVGRKKTEQKPLKVDYQVAQLNEIKESPINAQELKQADFNRLVDNIKRDGVLTTAPLIMRQGKRYMCISGHHRIRAAKKAEINQAMCLIVDELDESTRIRLQLAHNDIHGTSNEETLRQMQLLFDEIDIDLINQLEAKAIEQLENEPEIDIPTFRHVNICLLEESRERFAEMLTSIDNEDYNYIVEKKEYEKLKDLLTYAFDNGFKSPGQAFGIFMDIVDKHREEIKR